MRPSKVTPFSEPGNPRKLPALRADVIGRGPILAPVLYPAFPSSLGKSALFGAVCPIGSGCGTGEDGGTELLRRPAPGSFFKRNGGATGVSSL